MSYRVMPAQSCFPPSNVASGVTRPCRSTNLWSSDPQQPLAQWLDLEWETAYTVREVHLTFPGHLAFEYHYYPPFYKDPNCAKDYSIYAWVDGQWNELLRVEGNYQRQRKHQITNPIRTNRLRIMIHATNGDPSAGIYEVRCYQLLTTKVASL